MKNFLVFLFILFVCAEVTAQEPGHFNYKTELGLPSHELYDVLTDSSGFIWTASSEGLVRFDGLRTVVMAMKPTIRRSLSGLRVGPDNRVWAVNFDKEILVTKGDSLIQPVGLKSSNNYMLPRIVFLPDGKMAVSQSEGFVIYDTETEKSEVISRPGRGSGFAFDLVWSQKDKKLYLFDSVFGLMGWQPGDTVLSVLPGNDTYRHLTGAIFLIDHPDGVLILAQASHDFRIYRNSRFERLPVSDYLNQKKIWATMGKYLPGHGLWIASYNGVFQIGSLSDPLPARIWFPGVQFSNVTEDKEGSLWFSGLQDGLIQVPNEKVLVFNENNSILSDNSITSICHGPDSWLFIGLYNGDVFAFDKKTLELRDFGFKNRKNVETLYYDESSGNLFISSGGLWVIPDWKNSKNRYSVSNASIKHVRKDFRGRIWVASSGGIQQLPKVFNKTGSLEQSRFEIRDAGRKVIPLGGDSILFATRTQLFVYKSGKLVRELRDSSGRSLYLTAYAFDNQKNLIFYADRNGIFRFLPSGLVGPILVNLNQKPISIRVMKESPVGVWLGTNYGLYRWEPHSEQAGKFTGPYFREEVTSLETESENLFVGTGNGFYKLPMTFSLETSTPPKIQIHSFSVNGKDTSLLPFYKFNSTPSVISIHFTAISFLDPSQYHFRYRVVGLTDLWTETPSSSPFVRLIGLPSGEYRVEVETVLSSGLKSIKPAIVEFRIPPPFWKTGWFYALVIILFFSGIVAIHRFQVHRFEAEHKRQQERSELQKELRLSQMTALTAQMNPHFIFNALSSIQSFIFKNDKLNANIYLGKFSDLIRSILKFSEAIEISLEEEIKALKLYLDLENLRFNSQLNWTILVSDDINPGNLMLPAMIIQPYVENAIKHGLGHKQENRDLQIRFSLDKDGDVLRVEVEDNGIGRKRSSEINASRPGYHESFAHSATEKRLELLNQATPNPIGLIITDKISADGQPAGTHVIITLPLVSNE
ncbi:MAG: histidine kinase [Bacteroidetes bacterium]|nr:histidine kinase [Bacteroidota bacterium]